MTTPITSSQIQSYFQSDEPLERVIAARNAYKFGDTFDKFLIEGLEDEFYEVRSYSALSLGKLGSIEAVSKLIPLLEDEVEEVRYCVAKALGNIGDNKAIFPLINTLSDYSRETRRQVTKALTKLDNTQLKHEIERWLNSLEPTDYQMEDENAIHKIDVTRGIMESCTDFEGEWVNEILSFGLNSPDKEIMRISAISIGRRQEHTFLDQLLELKDVEDDDLRLSIIYALTSLEFANRDKILMESSNDANEFIRELVAKNLSVNSQYQEIFEKLANDSVPFVRSALATSLAESEEYHFILELLSEDDHSGVRKSVANSLGITGNNKAVKLLERMEKEEEDELVQIAIDNAFLKIDQRNVDENKMT